MNGSLLNSEQRMASSGVFVSNEAFSSLFLTYKDKVYAIAFRMTGSATLAEDIVQDVFLKVWLRYPTISEITDLRAYLYTATRNHVYNALKKMASQQHIVLNDEALQQQSALLPVNSLQEKEYNEILQQAIKQLPERQQQVYRLIELEQHKREEAAQLLGISPETVKQHLTQARRSVRAYFLIQLQGKDLLNMAAITWMATHYL